MKSAPIRVLFVTLPDRGLRTGGVRNKILNTKKALESFGVDVCLYSPWEDSLQGCDVCHVFQAHPSVHPFVAHAKAKNIPVVLSPVVGLPPRLSLVAFRYLMACTSPVPGVMVYHKVIRDMLRRADALLPLGMDETDVITKGYAVTPKHAVVVPNGVSEQFAHGDPALFQNAYGFRPDVLFVGRIDKNKNVMSLLEAIRRLNVSAAIIGSPETHEDDYYNSCMSKAPKGVRFIPNIPNASDMLRSAYAAARVFVLPSFSEVFPNAALEAGMAGCKVVVTRNSAMPGTFGTQMSYVDAHSIADIRSKIAEALAAGPSSQLQSTLQSGFTWSAIGSLVRDVYSHVLSRA